jgi:hypothetical protein
MAKPLRIVAPGQKSVTGIIKGAKLDGVKSSKTSNLTLGKDAGVDYEPKAKAEQDFVSKHKVDKHADRVGNDESPYTGGKPAPYKKQNAKVYEAKSMKCESCGNIYEGETCDCGSMKKSGKKLLLGGKKGLSEVLNPVSEGAKVDRMAVHIAQSEKSTGKSAKKAKEIAWATLNKRGYLNNKNKKMEEAKEIKTTPVPSKSDAHTQGTVDAYYGRQPTPRGSNRKPLTNPKDIADYMDGHKNGDAGSKVYEDLAMPMLEGGKKSKKKPVKETTGPDGGMNMYGDGVSQGKV